MRLMNFCFTSFSSILFVLLVSVESNRGLSFCLASFFFASSVLVKGGGGGGGGHSDNTALSVAFSTSCS